MGRALPIRDRFILRDPTHSSADSRWLRRQTLSGTSTVSMIERYRSRMMSPILLMISGSWNESGPTRLSRMIFSAIHIQCYLIIVAFHFRRRRRLMIFRKISAHVERNGRIREEPSLSKIELPTVDQIFIESSSCSSRPTYRTLAFPNASTTTHDSHVASKFALSSSGSTTLAEATNLIHLNSRRC